MLFGIVSLAISFFALAVVLYKVIPAMAAAITLHAEAIKQKSLTTQQKTQAIKLQALAIFSLAAAVALHATANYPLILETLVCVIVGGLVIFAMKKQSSQIHAAMMTAVSTIGKVVEWSERKWHQLEYRYLDKWWHEAALLTLGIAVFSISVHFLGIHQHAYVREIWHVMHLRVRLGSYSPAPWEMALFGGGFLSAMFAYLRLSQRLAGAFWYWRYQRRVTA